MKLRIWLIAFLFYPTIVCWGQNPFAGAGNSLTFNGTSNYIDLGPASSKNWSIPHTITAWIKIDASATGVIPIFSSNDQTTSNDGIHFWLTDTTINCGFSNGQTGGFIQNTRYLQYVSDSIKGIWVHVAAVFKTNGFNLYLNGVQLGGNVFNGTVNYTVSSAGNMVFGRKSHASGTDYFKGEMDELVIWDKALNAVEIRENMCQKMAAPGFDVWRYFRVDQLFGTSLTDRSMNNGSASAVGGMTTVKSGAALGNISDFVYQTGSWGGYVHNFNSPNGNTFKVSNVQGNPDGLHTYWVEDIPNTYDTIDWICAEEGYLGVFVCRQSTQNYNYNVEFDFSNNSTVNGFIPLAADISLKKRKDNTSFWSNAIANAPANRKFNLSTETTRGEYSLSGIHIVPTIDIKDTTSCDPTITLNAPFNAAYFYNWSNGSTSDQTTYSQAGSHWVIYGDTCGNMTVTDSFNISIGFSNLYLGPDTTLCLGDTLILNTNLSGVNHVWQDGSTNQTFVVTQPGTYWVNVSFGPCQGADTIVINYENVGPFSLGRDTTVCNGDSLYLDASSSGANTYQWNTGATTSGIWVSNSGYYNVVAGAGTCIESSDINISVALDNIALSQDTAICTGQMAVLWASGGSTYEWSTGQTTDTIFVNPTSTTLYTVKVSANGCSLEEQIAVNVSNRIAIADFDLIPNTCDGSVEFINQSIDAESYLWIFGDGNTSTLENPIHKYEQGGSYNIKLVASKNSCPDTLEKSLDLIILRDILYIPSAFTPNQDNTNDYFVIKGSAKCFLQPQFIIYNRWGDEIFKTNNPFENFWNGTYNDRQAPEGVYFYKFLTPEYTKEGQFVLYK